MTMSKSKELTPLEALQDLKEIGQAYSKKEFEKRLGIIETALKEHELMKNITFIVADKKVSDDDLEKLKNQRMCIGSLEQCEIKTLYDEENQKKLKALDIIKNKTHIKIYHDDTYECLVVDIDGNKYEITQEEWDILKEVLL